MNLQNVDELLKLLHNLAQHLIGPWHDNSEERLVFIEANGERFDIVSSPREDAGNPIYHSALIADEHRNRVSPNPAL